MEYLRKRSGGADVPCVFSSIVMRCINAQAIQTERTANATTKRQDVIVQLVKQVSVRKQTNALDVEEENFTIAHAPTRVLRQIQLFQSGKYSNPNPVTVASTYFTALFFVIGYP